jgi:hypothetical protein
MINDIKAIEGYESLTAQEIADALKASGVTHSAINRAMLVYVLNIRGMLRKIVGNNSDEKWTGTVLNMQDAILALGTDDQKNGIRLWFSHITNISNNVWDTTLPAFAAPFWSMVQVFADQTIDRGNGPLVMPSSADFAAIAELGGGWRYATVTAEQVQDAIDAESVRQENETRESDETRHEILLSANRQTDGTLLVMARVTPVEYADGVEIRRGQVQTVVNDANLIAALAPIVEGLI